MADAKLTGLTETTSIDGTELLYAVEDPGGTPASRKVTVSNVMAYILAAANTWTAKNTFADGTITVSAPTTFTQTWNDAGVTFTGILGNFTSTASASGSLLLDLQLAGTTQFNISKTRGSILMPKATDNTAANSCIFFGTSRSADNPITYGAFNNSHYFGAIGQHLGWIGSVGLGLNSDGGVNWSSSSVLADQSFDVKLVRDAAGVMGLRNSTNAQKSNVYATYTSSTNYQRLSIATAKTTLSNVSGATVTATNLIPDGAVVVGVTTRVTTGLGITNGTTGYSVGDGSDADRWGTVSAVAAGTVTDNTTWTTTTIQAFNAAQSVVLTALTGNFDATGVIDVCVQYLIGEAD